MHGILRCESVIVTAILLAAGYSTRFPGNKMLHKLNVRGREITLIDYIVSKFSEVFDDVVVVVGHEKDKIINALGDKVKVIYNPRYDIGMSESVKVGVKAVIKYSDIVAIHPADVIFILKETLRTLISKAKEMLKEGKSFILIPKYGVKGGHPLLISNDLAKYVLEIKEEERGLKGFLKRYHQYITYLKVSDAGVLVDIDTLEDLRNNIDLLLRET